MSTHIPLAELPFKATAFAARAHQHQKRKDGQTPYVSHVFRVCLVARHVFGFDDPRMLAAALLHDTIEDTSTDHDDLAEQFGEPVATWVAALTKNKALPHDAREADYCRRLAAADWQVKVLKLADIYDNLGDANHLPPPKRPKTAVNARRYLDALRPGLEELAIPALRLVEQRLAEFESRLTS
jgi:guanosine-3',5'-bis(diphosphate) 3'-pyrophosphohydrolase